MLKVFADFNARTSDGACFVLTYDGVDLERQIEQLHLKREIKLYYIKTKMILR
jgi:hypothetical protein